MKRRFTPYIYILFLWGNLAQLSAQEKTLTVSINGAENKVLLTQLNYRTKIITEEQLLKELDSIRNQLTQLGFLHPTISHKQSNDSSYTAAVELGQQLKHATLLFDPSQFTKKERELLPGEVDKSSLLIPFTSLQTSLEKIVAILDQKGQVFSTVRLINIAISETQLTAELAINYSAVRHIDKIILEGYPQLSKAYLKNYLRINIGDTFRKSDLLKLTEQINTIPFITQLKNPEVLFTKDSTHLYLFLQKKMINQFDGLVGFTSKDQGSGLQFNGYIDLALRNIFNGGEAVNFSWKNNGQQQQRLQLDVKLPYFAKTKLIPQFNLHIFKQDSTYVNTTTELSLGYALRFNHETGLKAQWEESSISIENLQTPNFNHFYVGAYYHFYQPYANLLFPEKIQLNLNIYQGHRTTSTKSQQSRLDFSGSYLWRLKKQHHIYIANHTKILWSDAFYENELFRVGGANSIRGFNEDQFFSNAFSIFNLEYRFNPSNETYFYSITDFGKLKNNIADVSSTMYSFGLGYAFKTTVGLLNLSYAIGGVTKQALNLNNSRLHIKFSTNF